VSNCTTSQAGHTYFTLKDAEGQLRCVMFQGGQGLEHVASGAALVVHGRISFYEARGLLEMIIDTAVPEGIGALQAQFEALKKRLEEEGLFDPSRKRLLPEFPKVIGVVTSPVGAVLHDICNVLSRRYPLATVVVAPTQVQGDEATSGIVQALETLNRRDDVDVIIMARGGGSIEELWPFNEEAVARAIYASRKPIVTGIGHETDFTIADFVADLRAPTPSAAAELVSPDVAVLAARVTSSGERLHEIYSGRLSDLLLQLVAVERRLRFLAPNVAEYRRRVDDLCQIAERGLSRCISLLHERSDGLVHRLEALDPRGTLRRGYAIVQREPEGAIVSRIGQVQDADPLKITVSNGSFSATAASAGAKQKRARRKGRTYAGKALF
jgi:exodeoxyribonuclease VII large subunit